MTFLPAKTYEFKYIPPQDLQQRNIMKVGKSNFQNL